MRWGKVHGGHATMAGVVVLSPAPDTGRLGRPKETKSMAGKTATGGRLCPENDRKTARRARPRWMGQERHLHAGARCMDV